MRIIFLDIDGVLNSELWYKEVKYANLEEKHFSPALVENLNTITDQTGAKIVVSSSWRKNKTLEQLKNLFDKLTYSPV